MAGVDALIALFLALWPLVAGGDVQFVQSNLRELPYADGAAAGLTDCSDWQWAEDEWVCEGQPVVTVARGYGLTNALNVVNAHWRGALRSYAAVNAMRTLVHELVHAYDALDDGRFNGSPGHPRPAERPAGVSDYCWSSDAEWYVCEVLRTGCLH